jgi:hypothetical protein
VINKIPNNKLKWAVVAVLVGAEFYWQIIMTEKYFLSHNFSWIG